MDRPRLTTTTVIAEAAQLVDEEGLQAMSLSSVARRLGVKTPSLYSHVRDLAAVQDGVTALALAELTARVSDDVIGLSGRDALRAYADALRSYSRDSPGRWEALQRRAGTEAVESTGAGSFVAVTDAVLRAYRLSPVDRVHATRLLGSLINGFISLERIGSFDHRQPAPDVSWGIALDALDALFVSWPART